MQFPRSSLPLACTLLIMSSPALAIYKCEVNGKIGYSDTPCASGKTVELAEKVTVTKADRAFAQKQLAQNKAEVAKIEKARQQREAAEAKQAKAAARVATARQEKCKSLALRVKWSEEDATQASGKLASKANIKAKRMQEQYDMQCKL